MKFTEPSISYLHISFPPSFIKHLSHKKYLLKVKKKKTTNSENGTSCSRGQNPYAALTLKFGKVRDAR